MNSHMSHVEQRLLRKQARLLQKLERVKAKLANRAFAAQSRRSRAPRNPYLDIIRLIVTGAAFGGFWWLGSNRVNAFIDELLGEHRDAAKQHAAAAQSHDHTFWTFGRRRRSGQSQIRPLQ
jgi:hypothetical protein